MKTEHKKKTCKKDEKERRYPSFVSRVADAADTGYLNWLSEVKVRLGRIQAKAAVQVNRAMLEFYWSMGRDLAIRKELGKHGDGIVANVSLDLRAAFPAMKGLSEGNIWAMKRWFIFYNRGFLHLAGGEIPKTKLHQPGEVLPKRLKSELNGDFIPDDAFFSIPWRHHVEIVQHCDSLEEGLFYVRKATEEDWSRQELIHYLKSNLYKTQGQALTNFCERLPRPQGHLAQEILKDPYNFDFLSVGPNYDEKELESALIGNITRFLLELGKGFAFVGRQMELKMPNGRSYFPDLVFYHIKMRCYVVVELKVVEFEPEHAGKLNFYVTAADKLLKGESDNPTVGLLICKSKDKTTVEWSLQDIDKPLGVASYDLERICQFAMESTI